MKTKIGFVKANAGDITGRKLNTDIRFSSRDIGTAFLRFQVIHEGEIYSFPDDMKAMLFMKMSDGSTFYQEADIASRENGIIQYGLKENEIKHAGAVDGELYLLLDGDKISVQTFQFRIQQSLLDTAGTPAVEYYIKTFEDLSQEVVDKVSKQQRGKGMYVRDRRAVVLGKHDRHWSTERGQQHFFNDEGYITFNEPDNDDDQTRIRYLNMEIPFKTDSYGDLRMLFYVEGKDNIEKLDLTFSSNELFTNGQWAEVPGDTLVEGWNEVFLHDRLKGYGDYEPGDDIYGFEVSATPVSNGEYELSFYHMSANHADKPKVILTFDDAWKSQYTEAFKILKAHGMVGNIAVAPQFGGDLSTDVSVGMMESNEEYGEFMSLDDLQEVYDYGWDLFNHTFSHPRLSDLSTDEAVQEVLKCKQWLEEKGFTRSSDIIAYPHGAFTEEQIDEFAEFMRLGRTFMQAGDQSNTIYNPLRLRNIHMYEDMSADMVIEEIDKSIDAKGTLILSNHLIKDVPTDAYEFETSKFQTVIDYIAEQDVEVITLSEWADAYL